jgi:RNA polymerase sigma factor (sigma-70 family)
MPDDDLLLLREYARNHSEPAFAALVTRHVNLVYSVAMRQLRDPHLAQEITQAVFIILARKAGSLGDKVILSGWLCRVARYAGARALRTQFRRQRREQEAYMQSTLNEPQPPEDWTQIAPLLDAAMGRLGRKDHDALVLRFFENKNLAEVGAALGASEDAAKMRVSRALEKLRIFFRKRGVDSTTTAIAATISANSILVAPEPLARIATAAALAKGATASVSTLTLIKGALKIMAWTNAKTAVVAVVATAAVIFTTQTAWHHFQNPAPRAAAKTQKLSSQQAADATQAASDFFNAISNGDWQTVGQYWPPNAPNGRHLNDLFTPKIKDYLTGMQVISLGTPYRQGRLFLVPYVVQWKDGSTQSNDLRLAQARDGQWIWTGGF